MLSLYRSLSDEQLRFNPGPESWNLLQVMRQLVTATTAEPHPRQVSAAHRGSDRSYLCQMETSGG